MKFIEIFRCNRKEQIKALYCKDMASKCKSLCLIFPRLNASETSGRLQICIYQVFTIILQNVFLKIWLEGKCNTTYWVVQMKKKKTISRCNRRYEQVVLFFRMEFSKQKFVFDFLKAIFDTNSKPSRPFFSMELIYSANGRLRFWGKIYES